jgi:hypothetical protein
LRVLVGSSSLDLLCASPHPDKKQNIMSRAEASGDQRLIGAKLAAKYDPEVESEVISWFKQLLGADLTPGMRELEKQLRDGILLAKLANEIKAKTGNCPPAAAKMKIKVNTLNAPFKQMENITNFVKFCEAYGVHKTNTFQTVDLFEGRNIPQVLNCIITLGTECQRQGFSGPVIGPKPVEKNVREFSEDQLKAGQSIIGLQAGTNKCASQSGMSMGAARHVADIRADDMDKRGQGTIGLQMGSNKGASQSGMSMGGVRHVGDIRSDDMDRAGMGTIGLQAGSNKGASQSGMSMGGVRHAGDIRSEDMDKAGQSVIGLQMGSNKGASQSGMSMGGVRHAGDIKSDDMDKAGQSIIGLQMGSNKGASQSGMSHGARHAGDISCVAPADSSTIGLQMGSNKGASQSGMSMGAQRHVGDINSGPMDQSSQGVINLQYGSTEGANQQGMSMGGRRDISRKQ